MAIDRSAGIVLIIIYTPVPSMCKQPGGAKSLPKPVMTLNKPTMAHCQFIAKK